MELQLIRNATMKLSYGGQTILTDPMFSDKDAMEAFAGIARNPTVALPVAVEEILAGVAAVVISHDHPDHVDPAAGEVLPKKLPVFCQPGDENRLIELGFQTVTPIEKVHTWQGIGITRTVGRHGSGKIGARMGPVSGFVLQADGEPTVYWVGDSIWCEAVETVIRTYTPAVIITHSGGATLPGFDPIIMDGDQTLATVRASPNAIVVAVHLEALDHCTVSRSALRRMAQAASIPSQQLLIPKDGEVLAF